MFTSGQYTKFYARGSFIIERSCVNQCSTWLPSDTRWAAGVGERRREPERERVSPGAAHATWMCWGKVGWGFLSGRALWVCWRRRGGTRKTAGVNKEPYYHGGARTVTRPSAAPAWSSAVQEPTEAMCCRSNSWFYYLCEERTQCDDLCESEIHSRWRIDHRGESLCDDSGSSCAWQPVRLPTEKSDCSDVYRPIFLDNPWIPFQWNMRSLKKSVSASPFARRGVHWRGRVKSPI